MDRKAVFLDVDGTLVNDRGVVPASARRAVARARANGHLVFLCTGRSLSVLGEEILSVGFDGIIAAAGGYVEVAGRVLAHRTIPAGDVARAVAYFDAHGIDFLLESNAGLFGSARARTRLTSLIFESVTDLDLLADLQRGMGTFVDAIVDEALNERTDVNKIFILDSGVTLDAVRAHFAGTFDVIPATLARLGPNSGEMAIAGVHKATGIAMVLAHVGVPVEATLAYGDGLNDLEMLQYVATGVAMGGAPAQVTAVADDVTASPDEDGLHASLRKYQLISSGRSSCAPAPERTEILAPSRR